MLSVLNKPVGVAVRVAVVCLLYTVVNTSADMLLLGDPFPNFAANTTEGFIKFHEWLNDSWGILFSHPADFTPVCTTELARLLALDSEFKKRNVKPIALSCDSIEHHNEWIRDIRRYSGLAEGKLPFPIIADENRDLAVKLNMLDMDEVDAAGIALTARAVFIVDSNKKFRLQILYPATTGRNFDEILRVIDSLQLTDKYKIATPADWKVGDPVMVQPSVPREEVNISFPEVTVMALPSGKPYLRMTPQP